MIDRLARIKRLRELDARIAAVQQWGAALTALEEERRGILNALRPVKCADNSHGYVSFAIALVCVLVAGWFIWSMKDDPKPVDCNTINHTRPLDGMPCIPKQYDRSRR